MISIKKLEKDVLNNTPYIFADLVGLSTDEKPTVLNFENDEGGTYSNYVGNGSTFIEIDTGDEYMFDLANSEWDLISGNGGGGSMNKFDYIIPGNFDEDSDMTITDSETIAVLEEINENYLDGEGNVKPLLIGAYIGNGEADVWGYFTIAEQISTSYSGKVQISFASCVSFPIHINVYYNTSTNKWVTERVS